MTTIQDNTGTVQWNPMPLPGKRSGFRRSAAVAEREHQLLAMATPAVNAFGVEEAPPMFVPMKLASRYATTIARLQKSGAGKWTQRQFDDNGCRYEHDGTPGVLIFRLA